MKSSKICLIVGFLAILSACGVGLTYCYFKYQFWTHVTITGFHDLVEYQSVHIVGYKGRQILVHNGFLPSMKRIESYGNRTGVRVIVTQSYRHPEAKLRGTKVAPARMSNHLAGHAIDFNVEYKGTLFRFSDLRLSRHRKLPPKVKEFIEMIRGDSKLRWGGDFRREDPIHIDDGLNVWYQIEWKKYFDGCLDDITHAKPKWMFWR